MAGKKTSTKKSHRGFIILFVMVLVVLYIVTQIVPSMVGALKGTEIVEYGQLTISNEVTCYIIRDETIYTSGKDADVDYLVEEGTLIKKGTRVVNLNPASDVPEDGRKPKNSLMESIANAGKRLRTDNTGLSQRKGIVSYSIDGYESYFSPATMKKLDREEVEALDIESMELQRQKVAKGEPIYKICSNSVWYMTFWIEKADISRYEAGKGCTIMLGEEEIDCTVDSIVDGGEEGWQVIVHTNRYFSRFPEDRVQEATVLTTNVKGILISNRCITTKDDVVGVYRKTTSGDYVFVPIQVLASDGKVTCVKGDFFYDSEGQMVKTVEVYDEVLTNPEVE